MGDAGIYGRCVVYMAILALCSITGSGFAGPAKVRIETQNQAFRAKN